MMDYYYEVPQKTHILLRRLKREYAIKFVQNGEIHFGTPKRWIEKSYKGDNRIGDDCEGVFASVDENVNIVKVHSRRNVLSFQKNGLRYFRSEDICHLPTLCFYGINDTSFTGKNKKFLWHTQDTGTVPYNFFCDISKNLSKEEYQEIEYNQQPVIVMIHRPEIFLERLVKAVKDIGLQDNEILSGPVCYLDMCKPFVSRQPFPAELFLKDKNYDNQSEIRIVLNITSNEVKTKLLEQDYSIKIGNIEDIASIQNMYFSEMRFAKQDNKKIVFELPETITTDMKTDFQSLVVAAVLASQNLFVQEGSDMFQNIKILDGLLYEYHKVHCNLQFSGIEEKKLKYSLVFEGVDEEQNQIIKYVIDNIFELIDMTMSGISG